MAMNRVVVCDFCDEFVPLADRRRIAVRADDQRPESAEYIDVCVPCRSVPVSSVIELADKKRPVMADGSPA